MSQIHFTLFGKEFQISSNQDNEAHLRKLISIFQERIEQIKDKSKEEDAIRLLVYLSLNFLDENIKIKKAEIESKISPTINKEIIDKIERIAKND